MTDRATLAVLAALRAALIALDRMDRGLDWCDQPEQARRWAAARVAFRNLDEVVLSKFDRTSAKIGYGFEGAGDD